MKSAGQLTDFIPRQSAIRHPESYGSLKFAVCTSLGLMSHDRRSDGHAQTNSLLSRLAEHQICQISTTRFRRSEGASPC